MQAGTAVALIAGSAGLVDKVNDGDTPVWLRPMASRAARHLARVGASTADACGFDGTDLCEAATRAKAIEDRAEASLGELLSPTGMAVSSMFAHTSVAAGNPANTAPLARAGDAFGRLVHLVDAVQDRESDGRHGTFNPLEATGTTDAEAGALARSLHNEIVAALDEIEFVDGALTQALLGPTLRSAINRVWDGSTEKVSRSARHDGGLGVGLAAALVAQAGMWGGGRRRGSRRRGSPYGGDPYQAGGYGGGYGRRRGCGGPSCGQLLACDCCANCCCNECCGGDDCCCCI